MTRISKLGPRTQPSLGQSTLDALPLERTVAVELQPVGGSLGAQRRSLNLRVGLALAVTGPETAEVAITIRGAGSRPPILRLAQLALYRRGAATPLEILSPAALTQLSQNEPSALRQGEWLHRGTLRISPVTPGSRLAAVIDGRLDVLEPTEFTGAWLVGQGTLERLRSAWLERSSA